MNDSLKLYLEAILEQFPQQEWDLLNNILTTLKIGKGEEIHKIGKKCNHLWFLEKGAVRGYEQINDQERTMKFFLDKSFFFDYHSVLTNSTSEIGFKAEDDCIVIQIPYNKLLTLYNQSHYLERLARLIAERKFLEEFELRRQLLNFDALKRYEYLIEHQPNIFQQFALKDIATFIGITPVSLSRLRKIK